MLITFPKRDVSETNNLVDYARTTVEFDLHATGSQTVLYNLLKHL